MAKGKHPLGDRTGEPCPLCTGEIIYNGNYFCEHFGITPGTCSWAAIPPGERGYNKALGERLLAGLICERRRQGRDTTHEESYLPDGHELKTTRGDQDGASQP